jgi:hypothetical protein
MTIPPIRRRLAAPIGIAIAAALTLSACGGGSGDGPDAGSGLEPAAGAQRLSGVCPDDVNEAPVAVLREVGVRAVVGWCVANRTDPTRRWGFDRS